jgi:large subunit ribosomal protein L9
MAKTEVILLKNIVGLGAESDQVTVAAGYARNYLIPQGFAIPLSAANKKRLEALRKRRAEREAQELNAMTELAASIGKLVCKITVKTGEDGKMFGAVTSGTIADELKNQFAIALDRKKIHLENPLRTLGEHEVELRLHPDVTARLKVLIESSTPLPSPEELAAAQAAEGRARRGARGGETAKAGKPAAKPEAAAKSEKPVAPAKTEAPKGKPAPEKKAK